MSAVSPPRPAIPPAVVASTSSPRRHTPIADQMQAIAAPIEAAVRPPGIPSPRRSSLGATPAALTASYQRQRSMSTSQPAAPISSVTSPAEAAPPGLTPSASSDSLTLAPVGEIASSVPRAHARRTSLASSAATISSSTAMAASSSYASALARSHSRRPSAAAHHLRSASRGLDGLLSSFNGMRSTAALGSLGKDDQTAMEEEQTRAEGATAHGAAALTLDTTDTDQTSFGPPSTSAVRTGSLAIPTPVSNSTASTTPMGSSSSSSSGASGRGPSKLLEKLVAAKIQPGEDTVRAMQDQLDSEREAAATLKTDCLAILNLRPEIRTDSQRTQLLRWMQSQNSFLLKELTPSILIKLCEKVSLVAFKSGSIVFRQGAPSESFFIIIAGCVSIWINPPKKDARADEDGEVLNSGTDLSAYAEEDSKGLANVEAAESDHATVEAVASSSSATPASSSVSHDDVDSKLKYRRPTGPGVSSSAICVGSMAAGEEKSAFGELGLVSGEARSATIKCEEYTELLRVSKVDFHTVLKAYSEALQRKVRLIASFPGFRSLPPQPTVGGGRGRLRQKVGAPTQVSEKYISKLSLFFREKTIAARTLVFTQGQKCDFIYFLVAGEVELLQTVEHEVRPGVTKRVEVVVARIAAALPEDEYRAATEATPSGGDEPTEDRTSTDDVLQAVKAGPTVLPPLVAPTGGASSAPSPARTGISQPGQILGESSLFLKHLRQCYDSTLRTNSRCQFLVISRTDFLRRINLVLLSRFSSRLKDKVRWREKRIQQMKLPRNSLHVASGSQTERIGMATAAAGSAAGTTPTSFRNPAASHVTSLALNSWTQRQKYMQLGASKNLRLLPELTSSENTRSATVGLTAYEEVAMVKRSPRSFQPRTLATPTPISAQGRSDERHEREREQKRWKATGHPLVPPLGALPVDPQLQLDVAFSHVEHSPVTSASSSLILDINPTIALSRRGSTCQMPDLRPMVPLAAVQIHGDAAAQEKVYMPHSLPMSLPVAPNVPTLSDALLDVPSRSLGASHSPARVRSRSPGAISLHPGDRSRSPSSGGSASASLGPPSSSHFRPISTQTGRVALTPEQHLVLSTQLRSTDAHTRAKQIVGVMRQLKERNEDWVITTKETAASAQVPEATIDIALVPVENAREMWQRREMRRDREPPLLSEDAQSSLGWEQLNPKQKVKDALHSSASTGHLFDPAGEMAALIASSASSKRAERMERATIGKRSHKVRVTATLLRDLAIIAPKSGILQEALTAGQSRNMQTHRMGGHVTNAQQLLKQIDWPLLLASSHGGTAPIVGVPTPQLTIVHHATAIRPQNVTGSATYKEILDQKETTADAIEEQLTALQQRAAAVSPMSFPLLRPTASIVALPAARGGVDAPASSVAVAAGSRHTQQLELASPPEHERSARRTAHASWLGDLHRRAGPSAPQASAPAPVQPRKRWRQASELDAEKGLQVDAIFHQQQQRALDAHKKRTTKAAADAAVAAIMGLALDQDHEVVERAGPKLYDDPEAPGGGLFSLTHAAPRNDRSKKKTGYQPQVRYR